VEKAVRIFSSKIMIVFFFLKEFGVLIKPETRANLVIN